MTQETTELQKPEVEIDSKKEDSVDGDRQDKFGQNDGTGQADDMQSETSAAQMDAAELGAALQSAMQDGDVSIEMLGENVVINFPIPR